MGPPYAQIGSSLGNCLPDKDWDSPERPSYIGSMPQVRWFPGDPALFGPHGAGWTLFFQGKVGVARLQVLSPQQVPICREQFYDDHSARSAACPSTAVSTLPPHPHSASAAQTLYLEVGEHTWKRVTHKIDHRCCGSVGAQHGTT